MKPEDINRAIAEHCGWNHFILDDEYGPDRALRPGEEFKVGCCFTNLPNYHGDLNAMHEAEKVLDDTNGGIDSPNCLRYAYSGYVYAIVPNYTQPFRANSAVRAEAFLRTIGKWKESEANP